MSNDFYNEKREFKAEISLEGLKKSKIGKSLGGLGAVIVLALLLVLAAGFFWLSGMVIVWLWNWLMPEIFRLPKITFWQAWGLVVLSFIFFGRFRTSRSSSTSRNKKKESPKDETIEQK